MTQQDIKVKISNLTKIFGPKAQSVLKHVDNGMGKDDLLKEHKHVLGLSNINLELANKNMEVSQDAIGIPQLAINANTAMEVLGLATNASLPLADLVAKLAKKHARSICGDQVEVELLIFDRKGALVGRNGF